MQQWKNVPSVPTLLALRVMLALGFFDDFTVEAGLTEECRAVRDFAALFRCGVVPGSLPMNPSQ